MAAHLLRLHRFIPTTRVEGPGLRACIQVQGCTIGCPGCAVPHTWSKRGGMLVDPDQLAETILGGPAVEGVTFLGGEPFEQPVALAHIATRLRPHGLSVMSFSGQTLEQLRARNCPDVNALIAATDLLIDGPFIADQRDLSRPWTGSANQRFHFLTDRFAALKDALGHIPNRLEIRIAPDGRVAINGLAPPEKIHPLITPLRREAIGV